MIFIPSVYMYRCVKEMAGSRQLRRRTEPYPEGWLEAKTLSHSQGKGKNFKIKFPKNGAGKETLFQVNVF